MDQQTIIRPDIVRELKQIDDQLAYLALLTCRGVKPLSRWEKSIPKEGLTLLREVGLAAAVVTRTVQTGRKITETIFGLYSCGTVRSRSISKGKTVA